jgi:hypothetical protein
MPSDLLLGSAMPAFALASPNFPPPRFRYRFDAVPLYDSGVQYDF